MPVIHGHLLDDATRCPHYYGPYDIIAIRFKCCDRFYPCYQCHQEHEDHPICVWQVHEFATHAIFCGHCKNTISIADYLNSGAQCPNCQALFNTGCASHHAHYFAV